MSDQGRRFGFVGTRPVSRGGSAGSSQNPQNPQSSPSEIPQEGRRSFSGWVPVHRQRLHSFEDQYREQGGLLPSLVSQPPSSPHAQHSDDAQTAAMRAMTSFNRGRQQVDPDRFGLMSSSPPVSPHPCQSPTTEAAPFGRFPSEINSSQRSARSRGMFKVPSFLSLRSNMSNSTRKGVDEDGRNESPTPLSPKESPSTGQWLEFGMKQKNHRSISKLSGNEFTRDPPSDFDLQSNSSGLGIPSLNKYGSNASSSLPSQSQGRPAKPHNWKQWDKEDESDNYFPVNDDDFVWHRPSFRQVIESLQVAIASGETVPQAPRMMFSETNPPALKPLSAQFAKRRPSAPTPPTALTIGPENPIPGRYRSHITRAIEGIHDIQAALDAAMARVAEVEESHERDLQQFSELSREWATRERDLEAEIRYLQKLSGSGLVDPTPGSEARKDIETDLCDMDIASGSFRARVTAAIEASTRSLKPVPAVEAKLEPKIESKVGAKVGASNEPVIKRRTRPAIFLDLNHDKKMSDMILRESEKSRPSRHGAAGQHRADPKQGHITEVGAVICREQEQAIERLKMLVSGDTDMHHRRRDQNDKDAAKTKKKKKKKSTKNNDDLSAEAQEQSPTAQLRQDRAVKVPKSHLRWSNGTEFDSSSSSADEDLEMYESKNRMLASTGDEECNGRQEPGQEPGQGPEQDLGQDTTSSPTAEPESPWEAEARHGTEEADDDVLDTCLDGVNGGERITSSGEASRKTAAEESNSI